MTHAPPLCGSHDPRLLAQVIERRALRYEVGADPGLDRPGHARGASGLQWLDGRLAVVQDDNNFIALLEPAGAIEPLALPAGKDGRRIFEARRDNKKHKWDLESGLIVRDRDQRETLVALGSGSKPARERFVMVSRVAGETRVEVRKAHAFYEMLRRTRSFSGSELNIEGIAWFGDDRVRLFQRGNGASHHGREPANAIGEIRWSPLWHYLEDPARRDPPDLENVRRYDLGMLDGVRLSFTDGASYGHSTLFVAAAEASPDAIDDGAVAGAVVGIVDERGDARWTPILDEHGRRLPRKAEGICLAKDHPSRAYLVTDQDDPDTPTELLTIALSGFPGPGGSNRHGG